MTSRERVRAAINHKPSDRVPVDLGSTPVTGIHCTTYSRLRRALGLPYEPVKVIEPMQMLAEVDTEVAEILQIDTIGLQLPTTIFGFPNCGWKPFKFFDGTDLLVSEFFNVTVDSNGDLLMHPEGDLSTPPSARMPKNGFYFDAIVRQQPDAEKRLDPREFAEEQVRLYNEEELNYLQSTADYYYRNTEKSLVGCWWQGGLGDIALVPGMSIRNPHGIRDPQRWYEMLVENPDYIRDIFAIQTDIGIENLKLYKQAVGDKIDIIVVSGTDFGSQRGPLISPSLFRSLWKSFYKKINDWIHSNTNWKTFYHSCGSIAMLMDDLIECGVDIINPVQCSAAGMEPDQLKRKYEDKIVFWGGGVNTQCTLPFGSADEVKEEVTERIRIFGKSGGFVFATIHNIQANTPVENIIAMYETVLGEKLCN
ncbi:MAG: uroporphyrinogen decarboxylase family protein [Verrucomicrobiia bacterium]